MTIEIQSVEQRIQEFLNLPDEEARAQYLIDRVIEGYGSVSPFPTPVDETTLLKQEQDKICKDIVHTAKGYWYSIEDECERQNIIIGDVNVNILFNLLEDNVQVAYILRI